MAVEARPRARRARTRSPPPDRRTAAAAVPGGHEDAAPTTLAMPRVVRLKAPIAAPSRRFRSFLAWTRIVFETVRHCAEACIRYARGNHYCSSMGSPARSATSSPQGARPVDSPKRGAPENRRFGARRRNGTTATTPSPRYATGSTRWGARQGRRPGDADPAPRPDRLRRAQGPERATGPARLPRRRTRVRDLDRGDWIGVEGTCMRPTRASCRSGSRSARLLSKSLRPLPGQAPGLTDTDTRCASATST